MPIESGERLDILHLYEIESTLVQAKAGHILTIRSLAVTVLAAILGASLIYPTTKILFLSFVLLPFYFIESTYDGYLIPIVERETALRVQIAKLLDQTSENESLVRLYESNLDHRVTPKSWNPFLRALFEPLRIGFYAAIVLVPIVIAYLFQM